MSTPAQDQLEESGKLQERVSLLEKLYILSQTETLELDASHLSGLPGIVSAKEAIVQQLLETRTPGCEPLSAPEETIRQLRERTVVLIERISRVEEQNRRQLEKLRSDLAESLRVLRGNQELQHAYGSAYSAPPQFSKVAE